MCILSVTILGSSRSKFARLDDVSATSPLKESREMRKKLRSGAGVGKARMWDALPWKPVDVTKENLGEFEDSVFFGLEEIDGNAYKLSKIGAGLKPEPVGVEDVQEVADVPVKKQKKSKVKATDAAVADDAQAGTSPTDAPKSKKADKKRKKDSEQRSEEPAKESVDVEEPSKVSKKKNKKAKVVEQALAGSEMDEDEDALPTGPLPSLKAIYINAPATVLQEDVQYLKEDAEWAPGVSLSGILAQALQQLGFTTPTPIQTAAIPLSTASDNDIVGAAETGSGKTLAFSLPIIHSLLHNWERCSNLRIPHALIIAPTRELALQISTVFREVCAVVAQLGDKQSEPAATGANSSNTTEDVSTGKFNKLSKKARKAEQKRAAAAAGGNLKRARVRIEVVSIVGGMSEQKQRRQLAGRGKPVHVVVATPGRLCEMFEDPDNVSFQDMSKLRFLVVDEADRIMEDGHYPELHRVFSRIRDHEEIAERGEDPVAVLKARKTGTYEDEDGNAVSAGDKQPEGGEGNEDFDEQAMIEDLDAGEVEVPMMPSEEDIRRAREECEQLGVEAYHADAHLVDEEDVAADGAAAAKTVPLDSNVGKRQTLLYSATAIHAHSSASAAFDKKGKAAAKKLKLRGTLKGMTHNNSLPEHLKQLLGQVGIQKTIHVVDVTAGGAHAKPKASTDAGAAGAATKPATKEAVHALPAGLTQEEIHVPTDEKDVYAYYYINKYPGRTLVFVNSIKAARRLDGLLRALGINSRALHAQLQQKQRLNALESFTDLPVGVLVATDVAARGLDIPKIQSVIHYDAARSPQVYVHRSGRTARAGQTGTTVSLVSPEDATHHRAICQYLGSKALPLLQVDLYSLPMLRQRVTLAKKIFQQSFIASQASKDKHWLTQSCKDADLEIDEFMEQELGGDAEDSGDEAGVDAAQKEAVAKKAIAAAKAQLQTLLDAPLPDARTAGASQKKRARTERRGGKLTPVPAAAGGKKGGKYKAATAPVVDNNWKRRSSFFVFAK